LSTIRDRIRVWLGDPGESLPAFLLRDHRGMFFSKRAAGAEDELWYGVADSSDAMQLRRILTETYADTLYESLGGGGLTITVQENDVDVDTAVTTLDFDTSDFTITSSPAGEANISLAYGTGAGQPAEGNHTHAALYAPILPISWLNWMQGTFKGNVAVVGGTTFTGIGQTALTVAATASNTDTTDGSWVRSTSTAVIGNAVGFTGHTSGRVRYDWAPSSVFVVKTGSTATDIRVWVGWFASDPSGSADPSGVTGMGFRFDTGAGDTNWMYWTNDATTGGTATSSGVAYAASTVYRLGIHVDPVSGDIQFWLNNTSNAGTWTLGGTVASGAGNFPVATTLLTAYARVTALAASARHLNLSRITHYHER
jgi:hypothetical protein